MGCVFSDLDDGCSSVSSIEDYCEWSVSTAPGWIEDVVADFASSYDKKMFSRIKRRINLTNVSKFESFITENHMDLIDEEMRAHSLVGNEENLHVTKSLFVDSVKEKLKIIRSINVTLYEEELLTACPTLAIDYFAGNFLVTERQARTRFLERFESSSYGFWACARRVLDMVAIKCAIPLLIRVFAREIQCKINDDPVEESKFDYWAKGIKLKCVKEFRKVINSYIKNIEEPQMVRVVDNLTVPLLQEIKSHKDGNRRLYGTRYNIGTYYDC